MYEFYDAVEAATCRIFENMKERRKTTFAVIPAHPFGKALEEFMRYRTLVVYDKYLFEWKEICIDNTALLAACTAICGHTEHFPVDHFSDVFNKNPAKYDYTKAWDYIEKRKLDRYLPTVASGDDLISDYGLAKLEHLACYLLEQDRAKEIIPLIYRMLEVTHPRFDLAQIFIEGGSKTLCKLSGVTL